MTGSTPGLLLIELNEFDPTLLKGAATRLGLRNIQSLLGLPEAKTITSDLVEHHGLDPWVQWVGIHSGAPSCVHGIKHLGQTAAQTIPQVWTTLGNAGLSWGVWGAMNAPRQSAPGCHFFFPDPWSFEEEAFPRFLNDFLALPRYMSKNYFCVDTVEVLAKSLRFAFGVRAPGMLRPLLHLGLRALERASLGRLSLHACVVLMDYFSTLAFVELRKKSRPDFSLLFLNNIAHLQHQFWRAGEEIDPELEFGLRLTDAMCESLVESLGPGDALMLANGLRQQNVDGLGMCGYRQINPQAMIEMLGITGGVVEQCMTNDAHVLFQAEGEAAAAADILEQCMLTDGTKIFSVEQLTATRIFFRSLLEHRVESGEQVLVGGRHYPFGKLMKFVCDRTGAHVPDGNIYAHGVALPQLIMNHEIHNLVLNYFQLRSPMESVRATSST